MKSFSQGVLCFQEYKPHITHGLAAFYLLGKTSAAQNSSFSHTKSAAALEFWSYLHCPLILKITWSKRNPSKFHILLGAKSCWELRVIGLARSRQKQKQFGIGWDKNHRISQENRSQRTGQRTSVKNGFFWLVPSWEVCQKVQKVPKKFPQAKFHCAAFPQKLSNGKTSRNFLSLLGLLVQKIFMWILHRISKSSWEGAGPATPEFVTYLGAGTCKEGKSVHLGCSYISQ